MQYSEIFQSLVELFQIEAWPQILQFMIAISPLALLLYLIKSFAYLWMIYIRGKFYVSLKYTVLEFRLPKDTFKSPLAMEVFLQSLHNTADGGAYAQYWKGEYRPYYSLELASIGGSVKFFVWCEDRRKGGLMSALYSQFPEIEIIEREDYAKSVYPDPDNVRIWGGEFKLTKPDPYPIKTYVDYGLDKDPKEEFKVDPLLPLLEFLGSVPPNQQVWIQFPIRAHKDDQPKPGSIFKKTDTWKDEAQKIINEEIMFRDPKTKVSGKASADEKFVVSPTLSEGDKMVLTAIERSLTKLPFDVGIRALYIAPKKEFDTPFGVGGIIGNFKHFNAEPLNGFKPNGDKWHNKFGGLPWEDYNNIRRNYQSQKVQMAYKRRSYFYPPFKSKPLVLNSEELATIYHFPGSVAATPALERIPSKKGQAPSNLPI